MVWVPVSCQHSCFRFQAHKMANLPPHGVCTLRWVAWWSYQNSFDSCSSHADVNLAEGKPAFHSSSDSKIGADTVVDGKTEGVCTRTCNKDPYPWLAVDLLFTYLVKKVEIHGAPTFGQRKHSTDSGICAMRPSWVKLVWDLAHASVGQEWILRRSGVFDGSGPTSFKAWTDTLKNQETKDKRNF